MMTKMPFLYRTGRLILGPIFKWYYKPTIIGKENIQKDRICLIQGKKDRPSSIVVNRIEWIEV